MGRKKDPEPMLDDVQIRLYVILPTPEGLDTLWVTSYYGPEDDGHFAALRWPKKCLLTEACYVELESKARRLFIKKIKMLNTVLADLLQPSHELEELLSQKQQYHEEADD